MPIVVDFVASQASRCARVLAGAAHLPPVCVIAVAAALALHGCQGPGRLPGPRLALPVPATGWALFMPLLVVLAERLDGWVPVPVEASA